MLPEEFVHAFFAEPWIQQVFMVILITLLLNLTAHYLLRYAGKVAKLTASPWDDAFIEAAKRPSSIMIWLIGLTFLAELVSKETSLSMSDSASLIRTIGITVCLAWFSIRFIRLASRGIVFIQESKGEMVDHSTIDALSKLSRLVVFIAATLMIMQTLGLSISGLLAAGGIGGIAIGFAAKDLLANFFGGLTIYLDRPFSVGDWIRSPDKEIEGTVEYISWRHTRIRGFNKNPIYVPNALFTNIVVENPSRMTNRRIKETIGIRYDDIGAMAAIVADVKTMLQNHPEIDTSKTLIVNFNTFGPSSLDFFIYTFTKTKEWIHYHEVKQDVLLKVAGIIEAHKAQIAFPTRTLHIEESNPKG